jgi:hypothetical protein
VGLCQKERISAAKYRKTNETKNEEQNEVTIDSEKICSFMHEGSEKGEYILFWMELYAVH